MRFGAVALVLGLSGCWWGGGGGGGSDGGGSQSGFGGPTLLVTAGQLQLGPSAPDASSVAQFTDERDTSGRIVRSIFTLNATSSASQASCQLYAERLGSDLQPFVATQYTLAAPAAGATADGTASPGAGERVVVQGVGLGCSGTACDGGVLQFTQLDTTHVEGFFSATLQGDQGQGAAGVVCSFWVPARHN